jgi:hypothetical protein
MSSVPSGVAIMNAQSQAASTLKNNRAGATSIRGGVGMVDILQDDAASTSKALALSNIVAVTTARLAKGGQVGVWEKTGVLVAGAGRFILGEGVEVDLTVDTSAILKGSFLKPANGTTTMTLATKLTDSYFAVALDANGGVATTIRAILYSSGRF